VASTDAHAKDHPQGVHVIDGDSNHPVVLVIHPVEETVKRTNLDLEAYSVVAIICIWAFILAYFFGR
jgi:hypothetical protein